MQNRRSMLGASLSAFLPKPVSRGALLFVCRLLALWMLVAVPSAVWAQEIQGGEGEEGVAPLSTAPVSDPVSHSAEITPGVKEAAEKALPAVGDAKNALPVSSADPPKHDEKPEEKVEAPFTAVTLQGLNKVTARISSFPAPLGSVVRFGNLEIVARSCWQAPPDEQPENAALLEVWELKSGEGPQKVFLGWMFASSPALSALEHPVYDISVVQCTREEVEPPPS